MIPLKVRFCGLKRRRVTKKPVVMGLVAVYKITNEIILTYILTLGDESAF